MNIYSENYNVNFDFYISDNISDDEHYDVNFDLKFDSFYNFIESLKESKKYYHDYCNSENIKDFDNEYIDNINILKGELLKYFILITNDNDVEKYVIINDTIKDLHNYMIKKIKDYCKSNRYRGFKIPDICGQVPDIGFDYDHTFIEISESDADFIINININYLTRSQLSKLILLYTFNAKSTHFRGSFLQKMNITPFHDIKKYNENNHCNHSYILDTYGISSYIKLKYYILPIFQSSQYQYISKFYTSLTNYLDSLSYETIYTRELDEILRNLPYICLSNISSKKLLNYNNNINLIDLDNDKEYPEID